MYIFAGLSKFPIKFSRSNSFPNRKSVEYDEKNIALMMNGLDFNMQNLILLSQHYIRNCQELPTLLEGKSY